MALGATAALTLGACNNDGESTADAGSGGSTSCPDDLPRSCPTPPPSYAKDVAPILANRCAPCHFPGGVEVAAHDLSTYARVQAQRGSVLDQLHSCLMPPPDAGQPTAQERAAVLGWLVCGAQNN